MSFEVGKPIDITAAEQLLLRQDVIGDDYRLARPELAYGYFLEKTPWIKFSSGVNLADTADGKKVAQRLLGSPSLTGDELAKNNILFNLTEKDLSQISAASSLDPQALAGAPIKSKGLNDLPGYELSDTYGVRPLPGIISMNLRTHNTFGSLRTATVNFVCWTVEQLEVLEVLFMRPGYTALLEWGHSRYLYREGETVKTDLVDTYGINFFGSNKKRSTIDNLLNQQKKKYQYNYDGMYGVIKNFSWSLRPDGGYDCRVDLVSTGEIIESLKINIAVTEEGTVKLGANSLPVQQTGPINTASEEEKNKLYNLDELIPAREGQTEFKAQQYAQTTAVQDQVAPGTVAPTTQPIKPTKDIPAPDVLDGYKSQLHFILLMILESKIYSTLSYFKTTGYFGRKFEDETLQEIFSDNLKNVSDIDSAYRAYIYSIYDTATKADSVDSDTEMTGFYYIKLGLLLEILNRTILTSTLLEEPFFLLETNRTRFQYRTIDDHVSIDPQVCLLPDTINVYLSKDSFKEEFGPNILDIFVNIRHVTSVLSSFIDGEGEVTLYNFLEQLLRDINISTGGVSSLQLQYYEDSAKFAIVDRNYISTSAEEISQINIIGKNSIVQNFNLTSKLSPRLGHMVAVSAQASPYSTGIEATGLAFLNKGLEDRVLRDRNDAQSAKIKTQIQTDLTKKVTENLEKVVQVRQAIIQLYGRQKGFDGKNLYVYDEAAIRAAVSQYSTYVSYISGQINNPSYAFIIPFELEVTLEGISGFKIMESFRINKQILPYTYRGTDANDIAFLVTGLEHQVNKQTWTTLVRSQIYITGPRYQTRSHILKDIKLPPADTSTSTEVVPISTAEQDARGIAIIRFFVGKGLKREQAAGFAGNFFAESGLQPNIVNGIGAYGLAQWLGKRKNNLFTLARRKGESESKVSFNTQLEFAWAELQSYEKRALNDLQTKTTVEAAAISIMNRYERPSDAEKASSVNKRIAYAKRFLELYSA